MSGALNTIYKKRNYKIYSVGSEGFIVHNTSVDFSQHHSHINNFNTCKYIIDLCIHKTVPIHLSNYLLESIIRLSVDQQYKDLIQNKIDQNNKKKKKEVNYYGKRSNDRQRYY